MASVIQIKRSTVAGNAPSTSNITTAELALNTADKRLYSSTGTEVFEVGSSVHSLAVGTGAFSFANGAVTLPSGDGTSGQSLVTDGSGNVTWQNLDVGNNYSIIAKTSTADVETLLDDLSLDDHIVANPDGYISFRTGATTVAKVPYFGTATDGVALTLDLGADVASNTALTALTARVDVIEGGSF